MRKSYVYKITCLVTSEYYFGSSFNAKSDWYWGKGRKIKERIAKYGKENFVKEILGEFNDRTIALQVENQYIEKFRNDEKCLNQMLNRHFGSFSEESRAKISAVQRGKIVSDDTRSKMSAAQRGDKNPMYGKHLSEETKAKLSAVNRGKHRTDEFKAKISAAFRGKKLSEEHKAKLSASHLGIFRGKHWRKNTVTGKREWYD